MRLFNVVAFTLVLLLVCAGCTSAPGPATTPKTQLDPEVATRLPASSGCPPSSPGTNCVRPCPGLPSGVTIENRRVLHSAFALDVRIS
jgi:hypothetical protein